MLTCMAEGSWPLEFKWLHNNRELTRFSLEYRQVVPSRLPAASVSLYRERRMGDLGTHTGHRLPCNTPEKLGLPYSGVGTLLW